VSENQSVEMTELHKEWLKALRDRDEAAARMERIRREKSALSARIALGVE
jgi:hypothetical protein